MAFEIALADIVTEFLINTCRIHPRAVSRHRVQAALFCGQVAARHTGDSEIIPFTTGSVAEFYIEPMLPHIGDIDVMSYENTQLAIPRGHPPPTQLPAEFHNYVQVMEIIDSHLPGYVYLELRYLLTECSDDDNYNAVEYDRGLYASNPRYSDMTNIDMTNIHGPALLTPSPDESQKLSVDSVRCVRCLSWPPQAADWPTRHSKYGWPDSATLDRVVSNGCDVVPVAHRQCRQHEWMGKHQWRLSFSRAEAVLLNSWMPVQQIVYHMLRYFIKTERLTDYADNTGACRLNNYHIKVLMLWACELKSTSWWTDDVNLVRMCVELLHVLAEWLNDARCPHYFIDNCNLIDNSFNVTNIRDQLMSIDEIWLPMWFVDNYIRACLQHTPYILRLFDDVSTSMKLQNAMSALVAWRRENSIVDLWGVFQYAEFNIALAVYDVYPQPLSARSYVLWTTELAQIDSRLSKYLLTVAFLHIANITLSHGVSDLNDEFMDNLATLCGQLTETRRYRYNYTDAALSLNTAATLMNFLANKSPSAMPTLTELSQAYLYRAWRCLNSDSHPIFRLANVYLSVLYYTTGEYQTAIDHCRVVVASSQDHSQSSSLVVQGDILPKLDDDIDNVLGLAVLYQYLRTYTMNNLQRHPQQVSLFTTKSFSHYLLLRYLPVTKYRQITEMSSTDEFKQYRTCIHDAPQLFIGDVLLFLSVSQQKPLWSKPQHAPMNASETNSSELVEFLQNCAFEHMATYRQLLAPDFGSLSTIVTTDFEALYAYKRSNYQQCLQLSAQNVHTLLSAVNMPIISISPDFIQFLDDDIVSLTAQMLMVNPKCRDHSRYTHISQLTLSLYLMIQCQLKLTDSVSPLAQILDQTKVAQRRCEPERTMDQLTLKLIERRAAAQLQTLAEKRRCRNTSTDAIVSLSIAAKLVNFLANKSPSGMSILTEPWSVLSTLTKDSMAYLYRAWRCLDSDSHPIFRLANIYLSVLYYTTGEYQTAIDHCRVVVASSQDHSQSSSLVVQGDILPKLDDDIDNVSGLAVLYQYILTSTMNNLQRHPQQVSVFTTKSFAHYLLLGYLPVTKCRRLTEMSSTDEFKQYRTCIIDSSQLFIGDVLLFLSVSQLLTFRHKPLWSKPRHAPMNANEPNSSDLVEFLLNSAIEHMATYRLLLQAPDFVSYVTIITTDFEALYAYKRGNNQQCLQLSTQNAHTLLSAANMPIISISLDFIQLLDDDIVSLTALMLMVSRRSKDRTLYITHISQLTLSLYLMTQCQLKLHVSVASLVQTLDYIKVAKRRHSSDRTFDQLTLKLIERRAAVHLKTLL